MSTLYKGGRVFDGLGATLEQHGVLVDGDTIKRIAPLSEFDGFSGSAVDTGGATLLPGLIDCHVHLIYGAEGNPGVLVETLQPGAITMRAYENAFATLEGGTTTVRDCGGRDYLEFAVRDACNAGRILGPTIRAAGRMVCMTGGHGNRFGRVADGVAEVIKAVREQIHAGSDLIKIMATGGVMTPGVNPEDAHYTLEEISAGIAEGHRFHKHSASHAQGKEGILNAVRGGVDSIEHGIFMDDECVAEMLSRGTYLVPTLAAVGNILAQADKVPAYVLEKSQRVAARHRESIQMFYKAGGKLAMGTDAGTPFNRHGDNARELAYMVELGVSPVDALVSATGNAAALMRLTDRGTLAEGHKADFLIVNGDPTTDISAAADRKNHRMVIKNGLTVFNPVKRAA
jgi:imidazolonepropionase-like amidohydrolase